MSVLEKYDMEGIVRKLELASIAKLLQEKFSGSLKAELDENEIRKLSSFASILSLSENCEDVSASYEIITRLIEYTEGRIDHVMFSAELVFSRLGNFPGRTLLRARHANENKFEMPVPLKLECMAREVENTVFNSSSESVLLTDFQYKFLKSLSDESALSISAPTSAGKSFVLGLDLIRRVKEKNGQSIVYVVPTRALISEVSHRIRSSIRKENLTGVVVRTAPFPIDVEKIERAAIYVFTQERFMSFLNSRDNKPCVTSLVVDEAHEIKNGKRGIILQNSIDITLRKFPEASILFASPLIKNPSYFLSLFGLDSNGRYFVEEISPVSQNLILISEVERRPKELSISLLSRKKIVNIGKVTAGFKLRGGKVEQRANLALAISSSGDAVISYSNTPSEAEKVACEISKLIEGFEPSHEIKIFEEFIRKEVHAEYSLADCILKGVAFHYGSMPSLVRAGIENLFKNNHLRIVCCTSTLLQGVNLPAKHIIIENPKSGDEPMARADFLNLAGRAGRLLQEFHGNIWCIRPAEWQNDCYQGEKLQEISSAISDIMLDGGVAIQELLHGEKEIHGKKDDVEAAFGKMYHDFLIDPGLSFADIYRNDNNSESIDKTFDEISKISVSLPLEIIESNQSLRPDHLQSLYIQLSQELDLYDVMPMSPYSAGAKARMEKIFDFLAKCFEWEGVSDRYMSWISFLAYRWVWGVPMGKILSERVTYLKDNGSSDSPSRIIRDCLSVLEEAIRFRLVKYFSAYIDILRYVATERGLEESINLIEPYHIYLEFGTCNRHALNLMALGLSRFTALYLESKFDFLEDVEAEDYLARIYSMNIGAIAMPEICKNEVRDLIG